MHSRNLDFLRSWAVLCVCISHLYTRMGGPSKYAPALHNLGVGGVVIFFVHTCLVLLHSLERMETQERIRHFYVRRFFRIFPLCWAAIACIALTRWSDVPVGTLAAMGAHGFLINMLLLQNFLRVGSVEGPLWSLPWEWQMYLVLPLLFLLLRDRQTVARSLLLWTGFTGIAALVTFSHLPRALHAAVVIPMFLGGAVAYQARPPHWRLPARCWLLFVPALTLVRLLLLHGDAFDSGWNTCVNATVCLLFGLSIPRFRELPADAVSAGSALVAEYSYGIYLFHVPMLAVCFAGGHRSPPVEVATWIAATAACAFAGYHLLERPYIRLGKRLTVRSKRQTPETVFRPGVEELQRVVAPGM